MAEIQTVVGAIDASDLGLVLPHEHIFVDLYATTLSSNSILSDMALAENELGLFRDAGGKTIVDQTCHGLGPAPARLREVAQRAGMNVIASTGFYWERFHPAWLQPMTESDVARLMVDELTMGIAGTDVRAGVIGEIGSSHGGITPEEAKVFRAAAAAQRETGASISTHALFTRIGLDQARLLEESGADPGRVVIGHVDTTPDLSYHEELLRMGFWIAYDSVGQTDKQHDDDRADGLMQLVERGYLERLLISSDVGKRDALTYFGGHGYAHVITDFLPRLRARGLSDEAVRVLTVDNPRAWLCGDRHPEGSVGVSPAMP